MSTLSPHMRLQCVRGLELRVAPEGDWLVRHQGAELRCGREALLLLEVFSTACSVAEATAAIRGRVAGAQQWMEVMARLVELHAVGFLVSGAESTPRMHREGWCATAPHVAMLNDRGRTQAYLQAIRDQVRADDVVLDLGAGSGVLAVAAALAGARHVYAVEASDMADVARQVASDNGVGDKVTVVKGWSTQIELPERATLMVSEIIGDDPLGEHVLELTEDARKRLLVAGARMIPAGLAILGIPLSLGVATLGRHTVTDDNLARWREDYGIDFSALKAASRRASTSFLVRPQERMDGSALGPPVVLFQRSLTEPGSGAVDALACSLVDREGVLDAVLVCFELDLGSGRVVSTLPSSVGEANHWRSPVWLQAEPFHVRPGQEIGFRYTRGRGADLDGLMAFPREATREASKLDTLSAG